MIGPDFEITPSFQPRTRDEALALARAWGHTLSHWNAIATACGSPDAPRGADATTLTAQADTAEVQRLAALWTMLPDAFVVLA